jgi:L-iditol 2-dehydrogenase
MGGAARVAVIWASSENRLALARSYGALTVKTSCEDCGERLNAYFRNGKADILFEASGDAGAVNGLIRHMKPHGRIILVGIYKDMGQIDMLEVVRSELEVAGSFCYLLSEFEDAIRFVGEKRISFEGIVDRFPLDDLPEAFESVLARKSVKAMLVI